MSHADILVDYFYQVTGQVKEKEWIRHKMEVTPHKADQNTEERGNSRPDQEYRGERQQCINQTLRVQRREAIHRVQDCQGMIATSNRG